MPYLSRIALVVAALLVTACVSAARTKNDCPAASPHAARIIIKVRDAQLLDQTYNDFRAEAREVCATVSYVRPLHGNVHLYEIRGADAEAVARLMQRFGAHSNVEYVEPDRIMRHQSPQIKTQ